VDDSSDLLIVGASARAAAFSALRAGLRLWCADLFQDADLRSRCRTSLLSWGNEGEVVRRLLEQTPDVPWMYTGGIENRPNFVRRMVRERPLWGNDADVLARVRSPETVARLLAEAGLICPGIRREPPPDSEAGSWLVKPTGSAGGVGVAFWNGSRNDHGERRFYFQEYVEGISCSAVYLGDGHGAEFLGATQQLIGEGWLHARPFRYSGSLGALVLSPMLTKQVIDIGRVLATGCGLRGLFGVDFIVNQDRAWLVEVNPRYPASVEVLEYALGLSALKLHRRIFERTAPVNVSRRSSEAVMGKAILFGRADLVFPADGPWLPTLQNPGPIEEMPAFADIPSPGQAISAGKPIMTYFAQAGSLNACRDRLREIALDLDRWLFGD
jgi:predicted ATP-grasp superfamily ATP-dependent carboligase